MPDKLTIEDYRARERADELAKRTGYTVDRVVSEALWLFEQTLDKQPDFLAEAAEHRYQHLRGLARDMAKHKKPGATSDHSDMYDEFGLPV